MSLLAGPLRLHDVADVERLARSVLDERLHMWNARLRADDHEDALAYLITTGWELSLRYDAGRGLAFSTYATRTLRLRVVDWYRARYGDSRHRPGVEQPLSFDALRAGDGELGESEPAGAGDPADGRAPDLARILAGRGGADAQLLASLREPSPRRAA